MIALVGTFPSQEYVKEVARDWFERRDYLVHLTEEGLFQARSPGNEEIWAVRCLSGEEDECIFDAAIGRILKEQRSEATHFAVAAPDVSWVHHQISRIDPSIRDFLRIRFLLVDDDGNLRTGAPQLDE